MVHSYRARIHAHFDFYSVVLGVVVGVVVVVLVVGFGRGVGLSRGGFAIKAVFGLIPACLCDAVCCQAGEGEEWLQQPGQGPGLGRVIQQCRLLVAS